MNESSAAFPASSAVATPYGQPVGAARTTESSQGAGLVSWGAIFAGAAGAAALSLFLLVLGTGLGLSAASPWAARGATAGAIGVSAVVWVTLTQLAASGMGGYLAGRLRARWAGTDPDEVYFRDTAHGFLAWAVATLATAALLGSAIGSIVSGGAQAAASVAGGAVTAATAAAGATAAGAASAAADGAGAGYFVDALMRRDMVGTGTPTGTATGTPAGTPAGTATDAAASPDAAAGSATASPAVNAPTADSQATNATASSAEVARILASALANGALPADDARYLGQMVAARTGLPPAEANKRVTDTFARMQAKAQQAETAARDAADKARKASAYSALWMAASLLAGAFVASWMATFGGRRRDLF